MLIATVLVSINIWTGSPLFAVWVGSRVQGSYSSPKMEAIAVVILIFAALVFAGVTALAWLNARYDALTGRRPPPRQIYPWMQSLRGERPAEIRRARGTSAVERIVVVAVVAAVLAFEVWFFFFAGSSLPNS